MKSKLIVILTICFLVTNSIFSQEIIQWRGIDRKGHYPDKNLLKQWPESGPKLILEIENIGNGYGSPSITEDGIYITGEIDSIGYLFAFDKKGNRIWKSPYGKEWTKSFTGSRSTPTIIGDLIYISSGMGNLYCFDILTGTKIWSKNLKSDFHGQYTYHCHSESPLILDDNVFLVPGGTDTNVVAIDRYKGNIRWISKGKGERPAYNSPNLIKLPNRNILVTFSAYHLMGIDAETGILLWAHEQENIPIKDRKPGNGDTHSNTVFYEDGHIYYFAGDGNCAVKLKLSDDDRSISEIWRNAEMDNYMGGVVKTDGYFFGNTTAKKDLKSLDSNTGEIIDSLKLGRGSIIMADDMLYFYSQKGMVNLVKPVSGKMELVSSFRIKKGTKEHFSHPVINKGYLYIRHGNILQIYDLNKN